jgi:hypothetical protein
MILHEPFSPSVSRPVSAQAMAAGAAVMPHSCSGIALAAEPVPPVCSLYAAHTKLRGRPVRPRSPAGRTPYGGSCPRLQARCRSWGSPAIHRAGGTELRRQEHHRTVASGGDRCAVREHSRFTPRADPGMDRRGGQPERPPALLAHGQLHGLGPNRARAGRGNSRSGRELLLPHAGHPCRNRHFGAPGYRLARRRHAGSGRPARRQ